VGVPVRVDERLAEFDLGAPAYVPVETVDPAEYAAGWLALETGVWGSHRFDPDAFETRVRESMDVIVRNHAGERAAVVCHGGVINSYLGGVLQRPRGMFVRADYTSISRVLASSGSDRRELRSINETPHLRDIAGPGLIDDVAEDHQAQTIVGS
jgi:2,3-bisphosphoglycerate-dependent phosphoglycerate mutase